MYKSRFLLILLSSVFFACPGPLPGPPPPPPPPPPENCSLNEDLDGDGLVSCDDPDCVPSETCPALTQVVYDLNNRGEGQLLLAEELQGGSNFGHPTETGDINGDGLADVVSCALAADGRAVDDFTGFVSIYLSEGKIEGTRTPSSENVISISGERAGDVFGAAAHVADFTGDGIDDVLIGSQNYDGIENDRADAGAVYLLIGSKNLPSSIDLTQPDGTQLVTIVGATEDERLGIWVGDADLDGDGIKDLILGADQFDGALGDRPDSGAVYVIKGGTNFPAIIDLSQETPGQGLLLNRIIGPEENDHLGCTLFGGDVDGDGNDDLAIAAAMNRLSGSLGGDGSGAGDGPDNSRPGAGDTFLFFGPLPPGDIDLTNKPDEVPVIFGATSGEFAGEEIIISDIDGDGAGELLIGALTADRDDDGTPNAGIIYIIPGGPELRLSPEIDLIKENRPEGVKVIIGDEAGEIIGDTLAALDLNGDGIQELAIGRPNRDVFRGNETFTDAGRVLILFDIFSLPDLVDLRELPANAIAIDMLAEDEGDTASYSMTGADVDGDGNDDLMPNVMRGDGIDNAIEGAGEIFVISGKKLSDMVGQ